MFGDFLNKEGYPDIYIYISNHQKVPNSWTSQFDAEEYMTPERWHHRKEFQVITRFLRVFLNFDLLLNLVLPENSNAVSLPSF